MYEAVNRVVGIFFIIYYLNMKGPNKHIETVKNIALLTKFFEANVRKVIAANVWT